jgi:hypothetical protein
MAGVLDRARNEVVDRLQLSGKVILQCDEKDIKRFRMSVVGSAILIASGYNVTQAKIDGAVEPFFALDKFLTDLLDQVAGSTTPRAFEGDRVTKAAVELYAAREEERRDAIIERFLTHFARMMNTIQRRLCNPRTIDKDAMEMQARLLKVMTQEELDYLASSPAVAAVADYSEKERQQIILVAQEGRGNPLYNQYELEKRSLTAKVSVEFAEAVLLPQNDPTEMAENARQQQLELVPLREGQEVPVSPRDNHMVHLDVLQKATAELIQPTLDNPQIVAVLNSFGAHAKAHLDFAEQAGMTEQAKPFRDFFTKLGETILKLQAVDQQAAATAAQQQGQAPPAENLTSA